MKLLFDENLSDRIPPRIVDLFPHSTHIKALGLAQADDSLVWEHAKQNGFTIVSKDSDFLNRAIVLGHPPKVIFLRVGNCPSTLILGLLQSREHLIRQFLQNQTESILIMER